MNRKTVMRSCLYKNKIFMALILVLIVPLHTFANVKVADDVTIVEIKKFKFNPQIITVKPGTTIRWVNNEKRQYHSVWFEKLGEPEPEYFFPEEFYERKFDKPGSFPYRCGPHPKMTGIVNVK